VVAALRTSAEETIRRTAVVAVLVVDRIERAVPLAEALLQGGIGVMELTLRTPVAIDALRRIRREVPDMVAGIGTVLSTDQLRQVADSGAAFGVSPGLSVRLVAEAEQLGLPFFPGIATPTDIQLAVELGCRTLKYFPAESLGGLTALRSMAAPFDHLGVRYIPLGGIHRGNLRTYLDEPRVLAVGGSWLAPRQLIEAGEWRSITENARAARAIAAEVAAESR
jgi:2-dehydro-3-deoxyphosphogluconate aldolase/(4S)-4-hydroxy-2-oxoglutarate aldolase